MDKYLIRGGRRLYGDAFIQGAKNAVLPLFAASILTKEKVVIDNCPALADVDNMANILQSLGAEIARDGKLIEIDPLFAEKNEIPGNLAKELRSSIFLLGSILGRHKNAKIAYPGGCDIGLRPINIHLKGLEALNVDIKEQNGYIYCDAAKIRGGNVVLDYPSVGATENIMMAAVTAEGVTVINNAAREPEICELQLFLNKMGAKIKGAGTSTITIEGVTKLKGIEHTTMPDRIVAGTMLIGAAMCGGSIAVHNCRSKHLQALISKLQQSSCKIAVYNDKIELESRGRLFSIENIETQPYPGFPTDLQAPIMAMQAVSYGTSIITENIFETRFKHVPELIKMGAKIQVSGRNAFVKGVPYLTGASVTAEDLRGGASLVLAGLRAEGVTTVHNINHIDRGYEALEEQLSNLGADIVRERQ
jgi:UDP-N-acetylglucosamine 1-carboxyvinyltransferase